MTRKILLVEDQQQHIEDARTYFAEIEDVELVIARDLHAAQDVYEKREYDEEGRSKLVRGDIDGVISDIYFPLDRTSRHWDQPEPIGIQVALDMEELGIPFVLCTSGYHHGRRYQWICSMAQQRKWTLADSGTDYEEEAKKKPWAQAYRSLEYKLQEPED